MTNPDRNQTSDGAAANAQALQNAIALHQSGNFRQAEVIYQRILHTEPNHPDALHLLGLVYHQQGQSKLAVPLIKKAIALNPADTTYQFNLGNLHQDLGQLDEAIACFEQVLASQPGYVDALAALGTAYKAQGRLDEAVASFQQVLQYQPDRSDAYFNLARTLADLGQLDTSVAQSKEALLNNPPHAELQFRLGNARQASDQSDLAIAHYRQALVLKPDFADACYHLGNALEKQGKFNEAIDCYRQALKHRPDDVNAYLDCARALVTQGQLDDAIAIYRKVLLLQPECASTYSNLLLTLQSLDTCSSNALFQEHLRYAEIFEAPLKPHWQPHGNSREPARKLKLGYVSADFCRHVVANFFEPILANHDKSQFEIYGYYNNTKHDSYTDRIAAQMDHFLVCSNLSEDQLAQRIRLDGIDILVDLSGHTALNRLPVFARKPAPVQASYIGYPGSTGLSAIDYRISDPWQDPVGLTERYHSEALVRIPGGMAFTPEPFAPEVNALPALSSDELVFACLNNLSKVNPAVVHLWARILHALPQARLMLGNVTDSGIRDRLTSLFGKAGIGPERLWLQARVSVPDYLALHHQIDMALDPFPYSGGTTTMHSLWMGVPVITLAGDHAVSRLCAAHLSRVGLPEFITHSQDDYVQCAVKFANDLPALDAVRQSLRERMNAPQCQPAAITRQLEAAYRDMWHNWCTS
ncbi:glycosyltransferase family 41 protein [Rhodoferax sp.]|uniref:O-linked N-acetylglucosamine transferase, SPINDLY family protein n=1 Tax=Rhodoferax sp. TaxID=50421 RepID=UPI001A086930|nr:glycosyltransferase family 41 protein [Rhodoferax sp.]MBE0475167.1 tetratricopeptide repeat protein [Rhodoferax sp.]